MSTTVFIAEADYLREQLRDKDDRIDELTDIGLSLAEQTFRMHRILAKQSRPWWVQMGEVEGGYP